MDLLGKHWRYINEGNVHIVIQIVDSNYVLRLIKEEAIPIDLTSVRHSVSFVNLVMLPMMYRDNHDYEEIIDIPQKELEQLTMHLSKVRPKYRQCKSVISSHAIKAPNLAMLSPKCNRNYCIEIKPKEGFMSAVFREYGKCYYCLKQFLKIQEKQIETVNNYCPLDLFSGDKKRMKYALWSLVENPQNNFRLFMNGNLVYHDRNRNHLDDIVNDIGVFHDSNSFLDFILCILLHDNKSNIKLSQLESVHLKRKSAKCVVDNNLDKNSFLHRVLSLQKMSENINIDTRDLDYSDFEYVPKMLDQIKSLNLDLKLEESRQIFFEKVDPKHLALISAIAKDCSVMISFCINYIDGFPTIQVDGIRIPYRISVTDLEPKLARTLIKRRNMEAKLIDIYRKHVESTEKEVCCKIQPHIETRAKQLEAWQHLIADYLKATKQSTIDIRESQNSPLFSNASIKRKLSQEAILTILEDMAKTGRAMPIDKSKKVWEVYWHSLDEWGNVVYNWACNNGMNNSVCTLFELREGENTVDEEFHGLDMNVLLKVLRNLEAKGKCELIEFDDNQGVKFF